MSDRKTILITGATTGIGRAAALHFARRGDHVIATGRNADALDAVGRDASDARLDAVRLDVTDDASIASAAAEVERLCGGRGVDVLVNNAGYGQAGPLAELSDADLRRQFETNVFGLMAVTRALLPAMITRGSGRIINVSSLGGRITFPMFGAYHASKYALEALSDALRNELAPFGVRVAVIEPGPIRTEFASRAKSEIERYRSDASRWAAVYARTEAIEAQSNAQAVGPEEVVRAIVHAADARRPRARYAMPFRIAAGFTFLRLLPTSWSDWIMRQFVGLTPARLAAPTTPRLEAGTSSAAG